MSASPSTSQFGMLSSLPWKREKHALSEALTSTAVYLSGVAVILFLVLFYKKLLHNENKPSQECSLFPSSINRTWAKGEGGTFPNILTDEC